MKEITVQFVSARWDMTNCTLARTTLTATAFGQQNVSDLRRWKLFSAKNNLSPSHVGGFVKPEGRIEVPAKGSSKNLRLDGSDKLDEINDMLEKAADTEASFSNACFFTPARLKAWIRKLYLEKEYTSGVCLCVYVLYFC